MKNSTISWNILILLILGTVILSLGANIEVVTTIKRPQRESPVLTIVPYIMTTRQANEISLNPFVHIINSTVTMQQDGIGYVDSVLTINNGILLGTYNNTTETTDTISMTNTINNINLYGSSRFIFNNSYMPSTQLNMYDLSQVTLINSTFLGVSTNDMSNLTIKNNSSAGVLTSGNSEIYILGCNITSIAAYQYSKVYLLKEAVAYSVALTSHSYLYTDNSTVNSFFAYDMSTGLITNNSWMGTFSSYDSTNITVIDSVIASTLFYGLVCNTGNLIINGDTITGLANCRNTTRLINSNLTYFIQPKLLWSVSAQDNSNVTIQNNNTILWFYAYNNSKMILDNLNVFQGVGIYCYDYSDVIYKNSQVNILAISVNDNSNITLESLTNTFQPVPNMWSLAAGGNATVTIKNIYFPNADMGIMGFDSQWVIEFFDQSRGHIENITLVGHTGYIIGKLTGWSNFTVGSWGSSVVDIVDVNGTGPINSEFYGYDRSVMTINSSDITTVGFAVQSNGDMSVSNNILGGSYVNTTTWNSPRSLGNVFLFSIAVVGTDNAIITDSSLNSSFFLHEDAKLDVVNSTLKSYSGRWTDGRISTMYYLYNTTKLNTSDSKFLNNSFLMAFNTSRIIGINTTFQILLTLLENSTADLFNVTVSNILVTSSAKVNCTGSDIATSTLEMVSAISNYLDMVNLTIKNCTATTISGLYWIHPFPVSNQPEDILTSTLSSDTIDWILYDKFGFGKYRVWANDTNDDYYVWQDWTDWVNGINLQVPINNSDIGIFNYTIEFNNSIGLFGNPDTVIVTIVIPTPPNSNNPGNIATTNKGTETIGWILWDMFGPGKYRVWVNDTNDNYYVWQDWVDWKNNTNLLVPINRSSTGVFNYTIEYNNSVGLFGLPNTVIVTITKPSAPSEDLSFLLLMGMEQPGLLIPIILVGIAAAAVVILVIIKKKK